MLLALSCAMSVEARPLKRKHPAPRSMRMLATAYCRRGSTSSGLRARSGIVAADLRRLPLGTRVRILGAGQGSGVYTVLDNGSRIRGRDLDIFMPSCRSARRFGKRPVDVQILTIRRNRGDR
jgi:3D (Asp-Asp-Asp) domain-containing protein